LLERAAADTERTASSPAARAEELIRRLHPRTGRARLLGVTGPPGSGKSTLVEGLVRHLREAGETVAVLAVDPTSPFTGGALLGDRIRMQSLATDPGVFIRSMATRGALGGLAAAAHDAVDVLDAAGFDTVVVETVGVGQDEVDVVRSVDTVAVVVIPGMGDDVQAVKAGLLEIADVFVLNKADREGADRAYQDLMFVVHAAESGEPEPGDREVRGEVWTPPVVRTVARTGEGIPELRAALEEHRRWLERAGRLADRRRRRLALRVEEALKRRLLAAANRSDRLDREIDRALAEGTDPYRAADRLFRELAPRAADRPREGREEDS
jgi:LAO/AO transport system kinase